MWIIRALGILLSFCLVGLLISSISLKKAQYIIVDSRIARPVKIVFLADLHMKDAKDDNKRLIQKIADQNPDIIALIGDMIDDAISAQDVQTLNDLAAALVKIAPVYYSLGNDELAFIRKNGRSVLDALAAAGATVLDESYQDIEVNGNRIRIGGLYANAFRQHISEAEWRKTSTVQFMSRFENSDQLKVLLCHRPDSLIFNNASQDWRIDLALSGHTHGGLVRIPLAGGLYAAGQGFFPKYDYGRYKLGGMTMFITSGLSGYKDLPRLWNRPEIAVLQLISGK